MRRDDFDDLMRKQDEMLRVMVLLDLKLVDLENLLRQRLTTPAASKETK